MILAYKNVYDKTFIVSTFSDADHFFIVQGKANKNGSKCWMSVGEWRL